MYLGSTVINQSTVMYLGSTVINQSTVMYLGSTVIDFFFVSIIFQFDFTTVLTLWYLFFPST
jgi:hypothetical protein